MEGRSLTQIDSTFQADGLRFVVTVDLKDPAITTLVGSECVVLARNTSSGVVTEGIATATAENEIRCVFSPGLIVQGVYLVQVRSTVSGQPPATVWEGSVTVKYSIPEPE